MKNTLDNPSTTNDEEEERLDEASCRKKTSKMIFS